MEMRTLTSLPVEQSGSNVVSPPTQQENRVYKATIIDQTMVTTEQGDTRVILTVRRTAKLKDGRDSAAGNEPCTPKEVEVWITLAADKETQFRIALDNLERLGFQDEDVTRLHPDHPEAFHLVNKEVYVRCKVVGDQEYWNLAWPREKISLDQLQQAAGPLNAKIAALRGQKGKKKSGSTPPTGDNEVTHDD
jgi:hypothetical protein